MRSLTLLLFIFLPSLAFANPGNILISVGDLRADTAGWKYKICKQIHSVANTFSERPTNVTCRQLNTQSIIDAEVNKLKPQFDYHIKLLRSHDNTITMNITNWSRQNQSDFTALELAFADGEKTKVTKEDALLRSIYNFFVYANNEEAFKLGLLINGVSESSSLNYDIKKKVFVEKLSGEPVSITRATELYESESPRKLNYLRAGIEMGVLLSAGMAIYYKNLVYNQQDFEYGFVDGLKKKFVTGEAILFDDNDKWANYGHEFAGYLYQQVARANGATSLESFLATFAASALWETLEYHEVFSINDQIMTPIGGYVLGEASYQTSCALIEKGGVFANLAAYALSPVLGVNHGIDRLTKKNRFASQMDCAKPRWSEISLHLGMEQGKKPWANGKEIVPFAGFHSEVINVPGYGKESKGQEKGFLYDSSLNKLILEINRNGENTENLDLRIIAQTVMAAYYNRKVEKSKSGELEGYDFVIGVGSGTTWNDRGTLESNKKDGPDLKEDFYGTVNILGPVAHATIYHKGWVLRAELGIYGDFSMVKSYALEKMLEEKDLSGFPDFIQRRGYYWGIGSTTLASVVAEYGNWRIAYMGQHSATSMIDGRAQNQDRVTRNENFKDRYSSDRLVIGYRLTRNLQLEISKEWIRREGSIDDDYHKTGRETRLMGTLVYLF